jgi:DNA processing protein
MLESTVERREFIEMFLVCSYTYVDEISRVFCQRRIDEPRALKETAKGFQPHLALQGVNERYGLEVGRGMSMALEPMTTRAGKRRGYVPPAHWDRTSARALLDGTRRALAGPAQLSLLAKLTPSREAGDLEVFTAGDTSLLRKTCVSVIGTRKVSPEGAKRARRLARQLVEAGIVVTSGLAEGVDIEAMQSAVTSGGRTIGVIGTSLDKAYPAKHASFQEEVYTHHLLVSQFPSGQTVFASNFPARNRLMCMLSDASIVIEASDTSGTLHQAAECVRLSRWLFITRSVFDDPALTWPNKFRSYDKCVALDRVEDVTDRLA